MSRTIEKHRPRRGEFYQRTVPHVVDASGHSFAEDLVCVWKGCGQVWHMTEKPEPCKCRENGRRTGIGK